MWIRSNRGTRDLDKAFREHEHVVQVGFYFEKLKRYFDRFPRDHIQVALFDDLQGNALRFVQDTYRFLGVDPTFEPDVGMRYGTARIPKNRAVNALFLALGRNRFLRSLAPSRALDLFRALREMNTDRSFELPPRLRKRLLDLYRDDVLRVGDLIQRDLTPWLRT
jgi:hypothetical protein